jgi:hypothetical protein
MEDTNLPAPAQSGIYYPDSLILYGVKLNSLEDYGRFSVGQTDSHLRIQLFSLVEVPPSSKTYKYEAQTRNNYSIALAYGYAFDGHCYRLDSPRIFIVTGADDEVPVGCGFDLLTNTPPPLDARYRMWRIGASDELLEIATNFGDAKTLILDANLPGKRSPASYAINMAMAHRGGRLSRD